MVTAETPRRRTSSATGGNMVGAPASRCSRWWLASRSRPLVITALSCVPVSSPVGPRPSTSTPRGVSSSTGVRSRYSPMLRGYWLAGSAGSAVRRADRPAAPPSRSAARRRSGRPRGRTGACSRLAWRIPTSRGGGAPSARLTCSGAAGSGSAPAGIASSSPSTVGSATARTGGASADAADDGFGCGLRCPRGRRLGLGSRVWLRPGVRARHGRGVGGGGHRLGGGRGRHGDGAAEEPVLEVRGDGRRAPEACVGDTADGRAGARRDPVAAEGGATRARPGRWCRP